MSCDNQSLAGLQACVPAEVVAPIWYLDPDNCVVSGTRVVVTTCDPRVVTTTYYDNQGVLLAEAPKQLQVEYVVPAICPDKPFTVDVLNCAEALVPLTTQALPTVITVPDPVAVQKTLDCNSNSILAELSSINANTDTLEALASTMNTYLDTVEPLLSTMNTYVDTVEPQLSSIVVSTASTVTAISTQTVSISTTNALLSTQNTYLDGVEASLTSIVNNTGTDGAAQRLTSDTATSVASSATSVTLIAASATRRSLTIFNNSTADLYVAHGATATLTNMKVVIKAGGYYEEPSPVYAGVVSGIWTVANGNASIYQGL